VKAVTAAQLSMASPGVYSVTLDEAIEAMRLTAADMSEKYKETSLSVRRLDRARLNSFIHSCS
jgi:L-serine deaminase